MGHTDPFADLHSVFLGIWAEGGQGVLPWDEGEKEIEAGFLVRCLFLAGHGV